MSFSTQIHTYTNKYIYIQYTRIQGLSKMMHAHSIWFNTRAQGTVTAGGAPGGVKMASDHGGGGGARRIETNTACFG